MAYFIRNPKGEGWVVADLPEGTKAGDEIRVDKRGGAVASVLIASVEDSGYGPIATIAKKPRARKRPSTCPSCGHEF